MWTLVHANPWVIRRRSVRCACLASLQLISRLREWVINVFWLDSPNLQTLPPGSSLILRPPWAYVVLQTLPQSEKEGTLRHIVQNIFAILHIDHFYCISRKEWLLNVHFVLSSSPLIFFKVWTWLTSAFSALNEKLTWFHMNLWWMVRAVAWRNQKLCHHLFSSFHLYSQLVCESCIFYLHPLLSLPLLPPKCRHLFPEKFPNWPSGLQIPFILLLKTPWGFPIAFKVINPLPLMRFWILRN